MRSSKVNCFSPMAAMGGEGRGGEGEGRETKTRYLLDHLRDKG